MVLSIDNDTFYFVYLELVQDVAWLFENEVMCSLNIHSLHQAFTLCGYWNTLNTCNDWGYWRRGLGKTAQVQ